MKVVSPLGNQISSMEDWAKLHSEIHWKEGCSAYSVADFILNRDGVAHFESRLTQVLERDVHIRSMTPEKEIKFD